MNEDRLRSLLEKYANNTCTPEENEALEAWINTQRNNGNWQWENEAHKSQTAAHIKERLFKAHFPRKPKYTLWKIAAAAVILLTGTFFYTRYQNQNSSQAQSVAAVSPGTKAAQLTLSDGTVIALNEAEGGVLSVENNTIIKKLEDGSLSYEGAGGLDEEEMTNTIRIPRGGQYQVTLSDGTHVWLNSASSITYPTSFKGEDRVITLSGEAYFEVAKDLNRPFKVKTGDLEVRVTGTHFNVRAHANDDRIVTTLLEGGVEVVRGKQSMELRPGQQALSINNEHQMIRSQVNPEKSVAWKSGYFVFNDQDIVSILKELARWYDVDIEYQISVIPERKVGGTFSRSKRMKELLDYIESIVDVSFKIEGRRVIVMP